ncbi:MAG: hypothetical protein MJ168_08010 [Clostridia bacterium]|nr:hypothetical protein [Clostridia bacterium]
MATKLSMKDAEEARDSITAQQMEDIQSLYISWSSEMASKAKEYKHKTTASAPLMEMQYKKLRRTISRQRSVLEDELEDGIKHNLHLTAHKVTEVYKEWLRDFGFNGELMGAAFGNIEANAINNLVTGQIYGEGWGLSKAIWGTNEKTAKQAYEIVAGAMAKNEPIYDTAKLLERYVDPKAKKKWNLKAPDGKRIYPRDVDYNAQRLARTLTQHAYQQTLQGCVKNNPFIEKFRWIANGSRVCPICAERDGKLYDKNDLPLDHPNGMCVFEAVVDDDKMQDALVAWYKSPDGTYPDIDKFAIELGYKPAEKSNKDVTEVLDDKAKEIYSKYAGLSYEEALCKSMGSTKSYDEFFDYFYSYANSDFDDFYKKGEVLWAKLANAYNNADGKEEFAPNLLANAEKKLIEKYQGQKIQYASWWQKLDNEEKALAKAMKERSGLTWKDWYSKYLADQNGKASTPKMSAAKTATRITSFDKSEKKRWIDRILSQTESRMLRSEDMQLNKLTDAERRALKKYTGSSYSSMNGYLRDIAAQKSTKYYDTSDVNAVNTLIKGMKKFSLEEDFVLRRGTSFGELGGFLQGDYRENKERVRNMSVKELKDTFNGTINTYHSFISTSSLYERGFSGDVEMIFYAPKGTQASSIMSVSQFGTGEGEMLLNTETRIKILDVEKNHHSGSEVRVYAEILTE